MAKYWKQASSARRKRRICDVVEPTVEETRSYVDALALADVQTGIERALEAERDEIVGRSWHDHHAAGAPVQYRNGYGKPRALTCGCGRMKVEMPRLREPYESKIVEKYERLTPGADSPALPPWRGHRRLPARLWMAVGRRCSAFLEQHRRLKTSWEEDYRRWKDQRLQGEYLYIWADGIYPRGGPVDESLALLVVVGVDRQGRKRLLAIEEGYRESEESWTDL